MQGDPFVEAFRQLLTERFALFVSIMVFTFAIFAGLLARRFVRRLLTGLNVPGAVEGTPFERAVQRLGTSTVRLLANLSGLFVLVLGGIVALRLVDAVPEALLTEGITDFLKEAFIAIVVLIVGIITGDKAELFFREWLKGIKVPEINLFPRLVKYSIFYVAGLVALDQLGVATAALLVLLGAYAFGIFFLGGIAAKDLLSSAAAGVYLLLSEPYAIGDEIAIDGRRGIVQEVDTFVTRIESDGEEFIIPNREVFRKGVVRIRE